MEPERRIELSPAFESMEPRMAGAKGGEEAVEQLERLTASGEVVASVSTSDTKVSWEGEGVCGVGPDP